MKGDKIFYRTGYKGSLWESYTVKVGIVGHEFEHRLFRLTMDGWLTIFEDYPWDFASGPTFDTKDSIRGSLVHDALYEAMKLKLLPQTPAMRLIADEELRRICLEDGMSRWRVNLWFWAVQKFGGWYSKNNEDGILTAP